eukprot:203827_1
MFTIKTLLYGSHNIDSAASEMFAPTVKEISYIEEIKAKITANIMIFINIYVIIYIMFDVSPVDASSIYRYISWWYIYSYVEWLIFCISYISTTIYGIISRKNDGIISRINRYISSAIYQIISRHINEIISEVNGHILSA